MPIVWLAQLLLSVTFAPVAQTPGSLPPAGGCDAGVDVRALHVRYSDEREMTTLVRGCGRFWTPGFLTIAGTVTTRDGLPLSALQVSYRRENNDLLVTVSLLYGRPHQKEVVVGSVRLQPDATRTIPALSEYGVRPITLWLGPVASTIPDVPIGTSVSAALDVRVNPAPNHVFVIAVTNTSQRHVMALQLEARRGNRTVVSATPMGPVDEPLIRAGATLEKPVAASGGGMVSGEWAPEGFTECAITAVRWDDGVIEGDASFATSQAAMLSGKRVALRRATALLREFSSATPSAKDLRERVARLPITVSREEATDLLRQFTQIGPNDPDRFGASMSISQQLVKDKLLQQLDAFVTANHDPSATMLQTWIIDTLASYEAWLRRLPEPF